MNLRTVRSVVHLIAVFILAIKLHGAEPSFIGKTVILKTSKESTSCVKVENYLPAVGPLSQKEREDAAFKVIAGELPGTVKFEWIKESGLFLQHRNYRVQILSDDKDSATFRIVKPLRGNEGVSLQSLNFPAHYITIMEKGELWIVKEIKDPRKAVFSIQELSK
jgi:hypothetical protein